jgi:hypothetical protein
LVFFFFFFFPLDFFGALVDFSVEALVDLADFDSVGALVDLADFDSLGALVDLADFDSVGALVDLADFDSCAYCKMKDELSTTTFVIEIQ